VGWLSPYPFWGIRKKKGIENSFFLRRPLQNGEIKLHVQRLTPQLKKFVVDLSL